MKYPLSSNNSENLKLLRRKLVECSTKVSIPIWDLEYFRIFGGRYNGIMLKFSHYSSVTVRDRPLMYYGSNRKSGSKGQNSGFPPYFYFRFDCYRPWTLVFFCILAYTASVSPEMARRLVRSWPNFFGMLPVAVAQSSAGVTKSQGEGAVLEVFFPNDSALYSIAFGTYRVDQKISHYWFISKSY